MKISSVNFSVVFTQHFFFGVILTVIVSLAVSCSEGPVVKKPDTLLTSPELTLQFSDNFDEDYEEPGYFNMTQWIKWRGDARTENGSAVYSTATIPGNLGFAGIGTRRKYFNPGLRGTNGIEVTFVKHLEGKGAQERTHEEAREHALSHGVEHDILALAPRFVTGMVVTISNGYGQIGLADILGVQVHFDLISNWGLMWWLVRSILPEDYEKYPVLEDGYRTFKEFPKEGTFITEPCVGLATRYYTPLDLKSPFGHRVGLYLTDDGNTLYWTLDGEIMDTVDITGFFSSKPEYVKDGAYVTISGAGYQPHSWEIDDVAIYTSPLDHTPHE